MRTDEIKEEINKLKLSEKLLLIVDFWDSIALNNVDLPIPEWQKRELDKRYEEFRSGKLKFHDWQSVHSDIREKHK